MHIAGDCFSGPFVSCLAYFWTLGCTRSHDGHRRLDQQIVGVVSRSCDRGGTMRFSAGYTVTEVRVQLQAGSPSRDNAIHKQPPWVLITSVDKESIFL